MIVKNDIFISVDVEASGPTPGKFSMLSLGACVVSDFESTFYSEMKPLNLNVIPAAMEVSSFDIEKQMLVGVDPSKAMEAFASWVKKIVGDKSGVFVGFNASFDWSFVNWYFHEYEIENPFGFSALDIKSYYMGQAASSWDATRSSRIAKQFSVIANPTHNALDDAIVQAKLFAALLETGESTNLSS